MLVFFQRERKISSNVFWWQPHLWLIFQGSTYHMVLSRLPDRARLIFHPSLGIPDILTNCNCFSNCFRDMEIEGIGGEAVGPESLPLHSHGCHLATLQCQLILSPACLATHLTPSFHWIWPPLATYFQPSRCCFCNKQASPKQGGMESSQMMEMCTHVSWFGTLSRPFT